MLCLVDRLFVTITIDTGFFQVRLGLGAVGFGGRRMGVPLNARTRLSLLLTILVSWCIFLSTCLGGGQ